MRGERSFFGARSLIERWRQRIIESATSPFGHAPYPLAATMEHEGDPGLLGPGSVSWAVLGDVAAFVGGIRGLLIQAAHPEVVAGVGDHSRYQEDPLGRLSRTSAYVTATTYGALPEVDDAVARVQRAHQRVSGISGRGIPYRAGDPALSAWVHNVLTDSFLVSHQVFSRHPLSAEDADRYVAEQRRVGALLGSDPMPSTAPALARWIAEHPDLEASPEMGEAVAFLTDPPLEPALRIGYKLLKEAAVATIPPRILNILELNRTTAAIPIGKATIGGLRWALGYSPSWHAALLRTGSDVPDGLFRQASRV